MFQITNQGLFIFFFILFITLVYLLAPILTPFVFGALLAFLMDPLVKKLEKHKVPHLISVTLACLLLISIFLALILMLIPLIQKQIAILINVLPDTINWIQDKAKLWFNETLDLTFIRENLSTSLPKLGVVLGTIWQSGFTVIEWGVNLVLTPIVFFYLLRDYDGIRHELLDIVPKSKRKTIVKLSQQCAAVLSGFFRGQLLVMLALSIIYSVGLMTTGLNLGLFIGLIGGVLSIVPYLGSSFVLFTSVIAALVQYGDWHSVFPVIIVFLIGQGLEGYVLTPYLVGERIGLHPVAVIFAILAGGTLFGFFGVLLALPVAAVIKVLLNYMRRNYMPA